ncbi:hypothetical protein C8J57DRAFT_1027371, partial [Mycena rebaudengoi]
PAASPAKKRLRATVEEVEDEDDCWAQNFPEAAQAGAAYEACRTQFEKLRDEQKGAGKSPWSPFESEDQWELARWLMMAGISLKKTDAFLKLKTAHLQVSGKIDPAFHNSRSLLQHIDLLPEGAKWYCTPFELEGDELDAENKPRKETVELWHRDPVECVRELLGNPS